MEVLQFFLGWTLIILAAAAPIVAPIILIMLFFGGAVALVKGVMAGKPGLIAAAFVLLAVAAVGTYYYLRWNGLQGEISSRTETHFVAGAITPEMLARPRHWHGRFPSGASARDVTEQLLLIGKIDSLVGDRRYLPLRAEKPVPNPGYWDETFRLRVKDADCLKAALESGSNMDACFEVEPLDQLPKEPHFGFGLRTRVPHYTEWIYFHSGETTVKLASCTVIIDRPKLPTIHQINQIAQATEMMRTGKLRAGSMDPFDKKEFDEMRKCRVELLRQFAARI
jgi:hypothetical protein